MIRASIISQVSPFLETITQKSLQYPSSSPELQQIHAPDGIENPWIRVGYQDVQLPLQGWKIHLSACEASMTEILERVLPFLFTQTVTFKVLGLPQDLERINVGSAGLSQIGKFIAIYPRNDEEAICLAAELDILTHGLAAPLIPSDRQLRPGSVVFYRYGAFQLQRAQTSWGAIQSMIQTPEHELMADPRRSTYVPPEWAVDPFLAAGIAQELPEPELLLANRYLLLSMIYQSVHSQIYLAVDLQNPRRCIVKRPGLGEILRGDDHIRPLIQQEAKVLQMLTPHPNFPTYFDFLEEQDTVFLVMEDLEGETLAQYIQREMARGIRTPYERIIAWSLELTNMLAAIHNNGLLYRDLKATNILISEDGSLHLIDFGLTMFAEEATSQPGLGTAGYMSPQQQKGEPPSIQDDIYGLGAMLFLIATGAEPSIAPRGLPLTLRPLHLLNASLHPDLVQIIERCLEPDPHHRFASIAEVAAALQALPTSLPTLSIRPYTPQELRSPEERTAHYQQLAKRLLETLTQTAQTDPEGIGKRWTSTYYVGKGMRLHDLNAGNSGTILALAELVAEFGEQSHRQLLADATHWLINSPRLDGEPLPGLYVGEAGVGTALLRAGQILADDNLCAKALERGELIATSPFRSPDVFNGTAGRIRFHLWLWKATNQQSQLQAAIEAGQALLAASEAPSPGHLYWRIPEGYGSMSNEIYLGYAHGAAGIADVLLDLYETCQQTCFLEAAQATGRWLAKQALSSLDDASGLRWPDNEGGQARGAFWCHGATGIGSFFLHSAQMDILPDALEIAERAARSVAYGNRAYGPVQCHGLASNIEFLLDMHRYTQKQEHEQNAYELAILLEAFAMEQDGRLVFPSDSPITFTPDYMVGYAGIALTLLRLADPQRPRQLSLHGLSYTHK